MDIRSSVKRFLAGLCMVILIPIVGGTITKAPEATEIDQDKPVQKLAEVMAIEILIEATDELPFRVLAKQIPQMADKGMQAFGEGPNIVISREMSEAIRRGETDASVVLSPGLEYPKGVRFAVLERVRFIGEGRHSQQIRLVLLGSLEDFAAQTHPERLDLKIWDSSSRVDEVIPWPKDLTWNLTEEGNLMLKGAEEKILSPGQSLNLPEMVVSIPMTQERHAEILKAEKEPVPSKIIKTDLGRIKFGSRITVRFLGRRSLSEEK